jgi:hypothetical protein
MAQQGGVLDHVDLKEAEMPVEVVSLPTVERGQRHTGLESKQQAGHGETRTVFGP